MYARRAKASHRDTISYEVDMLAFCADKLAHSGGNGSNQVSIVKQEAFQRNGTVAFNSGLQWQAPSERRLRLHFQVSAALHFHEARTRQIVGCADHGRAIGSHHRRLRTSISKVKC